MESWRVVSTAEASQILRAYYVDLNKLLQIFSDCAPENARVRLAWRAVDNCFFISVATDSDYLRQAHISFKESEICVFIDWLLVPSHMRGHGLGKRFISRIKSLFQRVANHTGQKISIGLEAGDLDGGYFWAARGFRCAPSGIRDLVEQVEDRFAELRDEGRPIPAAVKKQVLDLIQAGRPDLLVQFDKKLAMLILRGLSWYGGIEIFCQKKRGEPR